MISVNRKGYLVIPLIILFALEACAVTDYKQPHFSQLNATLIFLVSGMLISIIPFIIGVKEKNSLSSSIKKYLILTQAVVAFLFFALVAFVVLHTKTNLEAVPIDYHNADMIPQIQIRCERALNGKNIYAPIPEIWNGQLVPYFPAMWLPYLPLEYFGWDIRWTGVFFLLLFLGQYIFLIPGSKKTFLFLIPLSLILYFVFRFLFQTEQTFIGWTEESVVIGYYLLLGFALIKKNPWLIATAISLCLLSRYMLLFWIPAYLLYSYFFESKKFGIKIFIGISILVSVLFLIPFGSELNYFIRVQNFYLEQAINFKNWHSDVFEQDIGFAKFFSAAQFPLLHKLLISVAAITPFLSLFIFVMLRKSLNSKRHYFGLCSLKLTMTFFYVLIEIPFSYLFFVPLFFTLPIIFLAMKDNGIPMTIDQ